MMGYQALVNAIIIQAAKDYKRVLRIIKKHPGSQAAMVEAKKLERFFHSRWYGVLTEVNPDYLMRQIQREAIKK